VAGVRRSRRDALTPAGIEQRRREERVPAAGLFDRDDELRITLGAECLAHEGPDRVRSQRRGTHDGRPRLGEQLLERAAPGALSGGTGGPEEQDGHAVEAAREIPEPPERRCIRPVQIVHGDEERSTSCVRRQPVQAVQHRERRCAGIRQVEAVRRRREQRRRDRGSSTQELVALVTGDAVEQRLEELAHDAEREFLLDLTGPGGQHLEALPDRHPPNLCQEARLADPRRAEQHDHPTGPVLRGSEIGRECSELRRPLEQRRPHRRARTSDHRHVDPTRLS
jgi:hypothetical protein